MKNEIDDIAVRPHLQAECRTGMEFELENCSEKCAAAAVFQLPPFSGVFTQGTIRTPSPVNLTNNPACQTWAQAAGRSSVPRRFCPAQAMNFIGHSRQK